MDEIVPINKLKPMRGPQGLAFGGPSNQLLAEGPPTTDQGPKYAESTLEDKYRNLSPEERNQIFRFFDDYHDYLLPDREQDLSTIVDVKLPKEPAFLRRRTTLMRKK